MLVRKSFSSRAKGAFKGVVVLPVREIGEVIFADFSCRAEVKRRQVCHIFARVRVRALSRTQRFQLVAPK
jgi:hypothetical protein